MTNSSLFLSVRAWVLSLWDTLGPDLAWAVWWAVAVVWIVGGSVAIYYLSRRALGHRKFRGAWYNEGQWQELVNMLFEDQQKGYRVMRHDEIRVLREWQFGSNKNLGLDRRNSYFS